jgi:membrane protein
MARKALTFPIAAASRVLALAWWYLRSIGRKLAADDILFLASGIAFNGIITLIPLLLLGAAALGTFLNSSEFAVQRAHDILNTIFPAQPFSTSIKESLLAVISDIIVHRGTLGLFGVIVLLYTATSLFDAVRSVLHKIYEVPKSRGVLKNLVRHLGFVALAFILFIGSSVSVWFVSVMNGLAIHVPALQGLAPPSVYDALPVLTIFVLTVFMFYVIYRHIPDTMPPRGAAVISTITTSVLWVISGRLFSLYLSNFSAIATIYGPYAFILVLLVWVYYSSLVFVVGAIVGQVHWERRKRGREIPFVDKPSAL